MSPENVEIVRSIVAAWEQGDFSRIEWAHAEIELVRPDGPVPGRGTGLAYLAEEEREFLNAWEDYRLQAEEYRQLDDERVLVRVKHGGRGKMSGLEVGEMTATGATLFHIRDGTVVRLVLYWDYERAVTDLGLAD